ncbi:ABC transporter substrate-binding protein [Paenibacillus chartarius]|uniref:ABC transporter substrate-binding protein n=1 Tax=Paenibacillus chartarius TaxID=747481 RepID=A0ABV6DG17_9BACL
MDARTRTRELLAASPAHLCACSRVRSLDPAQLYYSRDLHFIKQVFDTLVRFDPVYQSLEPHLAYAWECDESACSWTFYLRKGVHFHHGRELTAGDAAWTHQTVLQPDGGRYVVKHAGLR